MVYGMYQSAAGMQLNQYRQEVLANNLANIETVGFKKDLAVVSERPLAIHEPSARPDWSDPQLSGMTGGSFVSPTYTTFTQGPLQHTGGRLDVALMGQGFFAVQDAGETRYTRDGRFILNDQGKLVTVSGHSVLGEDGRPIVVPPTATDRVTISGSGAVRAGEQQFGRLAVVDFEDKQQLRKVGANVFEARAGAEPRQAPASMQVGFVEGSTVEPTQAMVSMIEVSRAYELNATMIGVADGTLARAVNDIARLQ